MRKRQNRFVYLTILFPLWCQIVSMCDEASYSWFHMALLEENLSAISWCTKQHYTIFTLLHFEPNLEPNEIKVIRQIRNDGAPRVINKNPWGNYELEASWLSIDARTANKTCYLIDTDGYELNLNIRSAYSYFFLEKSSYH
jgi:hypothetical protein